MSGSHVCHIIIALVPIHAPYFFNLASNGCGTERHIFDKEPVFAQ